MSEAAILAILQVALKFGWPAALSAARAFRGATADDAIKALEAAASKSAEDYLAEAKTRGQLRIGDSPG
jgi:hypothetical protein